MKNKKRILALTTALLMTFTAAPTAYGSNVATAENTAGAGTNALTTAAAGVLKWSYKEGNSYATAPTPPTVIKGKIYTGIKNKVRILDGETGEVLKSSGTLKGTMGYATIPLTYVEEKNLILVPLNDGQVQALDADSLKSLWVTEKILGQSSICPIVSDGEYFYTGTWYTDVRTGYYRCFSLSDENTNSGTEEKTPVWQVSHDGGFYWAGCAVSDGKVVFASEDGIRDGSTETSDAKLYCCMDGSAYEAQGATDPILSTMTVEGDARSTVLYSENENAWFFTSKAGLLYKVYINSSGIINEGMTETLDLGGESVGSLAYYEGKIYLGTSANTSGGTGGTSVMAVDPKTMTLNDSAKAGGRVQGGVQIISGENQGEAFIYGSTNTATGGLFRIRADLSGAKVGLDAAEAFFMPAKVMREYCISPVVRYGDTLYYKNDSCTVMAIAGDGLAQPYVTLAAGKKKITVKWTKSAGADGYKVYRSTSKNGKYKAVKTVKKASTLKWTNKNLKAKKKYYYKVKAYKKAGGATTESLLSVVKSVKTKK